MAEVTFAGKDGAKIHTFVTMWLASGAKSFAKQGVSVRDVIFRDGRVTKFGTVRRSLTDPNGAREASRMLIEFDDTDNAMRDLNVASPFKGRECAITRIDDATRRAGSAEVRFLFRGIMSTPQRSGFIFSVEVLDLIAHDADVELPQRRIKQSIFNAVLTTAGNKKCLNQIVPIIYGEHLGSDHEPWPIPIIPIDTEVINGVTFGRLMVCGHAVKEIVKVFRNGSNVTSGARIYIPGKASWTGNANFTAAGFNTLMYRDLGPERYTIIYVHAGDWNKYRDGIWTLHCTIRGIEDSASANGTGTVISSVYFQAAHCLQHYVIGNQLTTPVAMPTFTNGDAKIDTAAFTAADTDANATHGTMSGRAYIGQAFLKDDLLATFATSGDFDIFIARNGAVSCSKFRKTDASVATWTEKSHVKAGSFQHQTVDAEHANELTYRYGERYVQSGWLGDGASLRNNAYIVSQGRRYVLKQPLELPLLRDATQAKNLIIYRLNRIVNPPVVVTFTVSLVEGHDREIGDVVSLRHTDPGWTPTARKLRIEAMETDFDSPDVRITARDHDQVLNTFDYYYQAISTLTRVGKVATANFASPHGLTSGDRGFISDAVPTGFNGNYFFTVIDADTVTYTMLADPGANNSGFPYLETWIAQEESGLPPPRKTKARRIAPVPTGDVK